MNTFQMAFVPKMTQKAKDRNPKHITVRLYRRSFYGPSAPLTDADGSGKIVTSRISGPTQWLFVTSLVSSPSRVG